MHQNYHRQKTIFILRGLPGSGRTTRARALKKKRGGVGVIISTSDYFRTRSGNRDEYDFIPRKFHRAHMLARRKALRALEEGVDTVIINNPNMPLWHMYPYVLMAFNRGYWVKFVEMRKTWNLPLGELYRRSGCKVKPEVLKSMKESYQKVRHICDILHDDECIRRWSNRREMIENNW